MNKIIIASTSHCAQTEMSEATGGGANHGRTVTDLWQLMAAQGHVMVCAQEGHPRTCYLTWEQFGKAFHLAADQADRRPEHLICARCYRGFTVYTINNSRYMFAGQLEGTVRIIAESQAGVPSAGEGSD